MKTPTTLPPRGPRGWALGLALLLGASACASRALPASLPGALSPSAPAASTAPLGRMLLSDPPLPGEPTEGWLGLGETPAAASSSPPAHGGHDHGH